MVAKSFEVGDLVWAKMKGYSPWPGKIIEPPVNAKSPKAKKYHHYVFFFGTNNHAWIPDVGIFLHNDSLVQKYGNNKKTALFQSAVETIIKNSKDDSKYDKRNESYEMQIDEDADSDKEKEEENSYDELSSNEASPKNKIPLKRKKILKNLHSNSTQKKIIKKKQPLRKPAYSLDRSDLESFDRAPPNAALESTYADLLANIPPNSKFMDEDKHSSRKHVERPHTPPDDLSYESEVVKRKAIEPTSNISPNTGYLGDDMLSSTPSSGVLSRKYIERPDTPPIDLCYKSEVLKKKAIEPTNKKIGFLGLNKFGQGIVKNLQQSGHSLLIWNSTPEERLAFEEKLNIPCAATPQDVVFASDITFCCVNDGDAAKALVYGNCGVLKGIEMGAEGGETKCYVEMTRMDPKISQAIADEIKTRGGRYLEAPLTGSRLEANEGTLFILAAGDQSLYEDCQSCLTAVSKKHVFVGAEVGTAAKLSIIHNTLIGTVYGAIAESLALVSRTKLKEEDFLEILKFGVLNNDVLINKGVSMIKNDYVTNTSLTHMQKDLNLGLRLGDEIGQPTPILAAANEIYKHCKQLGYGDHDVSAIYEGTKP